MAKCGSCEAGGPTTRDAQPAWLAALKKERTDALAKISFKGGVFETPELAWTQTSYIQPQMHPYDRYFYDPQVGYTVDKFLDDLKERYGGVDSILMWPTYTNVSAAAAAAATHLHICSPHLLTPPAPSRHPRQIGSDDRNQFDYFRAMPGGLDGVRNVTLQLKARGVRVLWPYNPWDKGTRREDGGRTDEDTFAALLKQTAGDGFNGDTMGSVPESFWAAAQKVGYPLAFEPEGGGIDDALNWSTMGWGYWSYPSQNGPPGVDRQKFLTRGKFMTNICNRWAQSKTNDLQSAWFNGAGYETWENVWGTWNGIVARDAEAIRRVSAMLRFFGGKVDSTSFPTPKRDFLHSPLWEPHWQGAMQQGVYASRFPLGNDTDHNLYTLINNGATNTTGQQLWMDGPLPPSAVVYDCYSGAELKTETPSVVPPPQIPHGYNGYFSSNVYSGHGGDDIDTDPVPDLTVDQCASRCTDDVKCGCVAYKPGSGATGDCWKRANCQPENFLVGAPYNTFMKSTGYATWSSRNCYSGNGGTEIDKNAVGNMTADQCQARCDADSVCSCVTYHAEARQCWKRGECKPAGFKNDATFVTYVRQSLQPSCAGGAGCDASVQPPAGAVAVSFDLEAPGYGCVLQTTSPVDAELTAFLAKMRAMTSKPLAAYDATWKYLEQARVAIPKTALQSAPPAGTVHVPANGAWHFVVKGVEIEGDDNHGVDVQYPWEPHPAREHDHTLAVGPFYMDTFPVTASNYSAYLVASGFRPKDPYRWLLNWNGSQPTPPAALADVPVTYVSLGEARAYCAWKGARLPHEHEWQYAAQGNDGRAYPWGATKDQTKYPKTTTGTVFRGPESVFAHPQGASPFGVMDLVGNVWQYTDEFQDDHTRGVLTRGGSNYYPTGSHWYYPQALELGSHNKYFLMDDRYERAGTIGFRCVVDAAE